MADRVVDERRTVGTVARLAGITVRTLHHYDEVGLLHPTGRTAAGYRVYGDDDLLRLQRILAYRELGLALEDIAAVLDDPAIDPVAHLRAQHALVSARIERLRRQLTAIERTMEARQMGIQLDPEEMFEVFGEHDPSAHEAEVEQRWGDTEAYRESRRRTTRYTKADWQACQAEGGAAVQSMLAAMSAGLPPSSPEAMAGAEAHRAHIDRWFYPCSHQMQCGLADMYLADPRFSAFYEDVAPGLAQYVHDAIHANAARHAEGHPRP